jgi:hypothetical protein
MRSLWHIVLGAVVLILPTLVHAQDPSTSNESNQPPGLPAPPQLPESEEGTVRALAQTSEALQQGVQALQQQQQIQPAVFQEEDPVKKRLDLLQKQIENLDKRIRLLDEKLSKQPPAGAAFDKLQQETAALKTRAVQAARRDEELARAIDDLIERQDAEERYGPRLPATLKELFLPTRPNETALSIYGQLFGGYQEINGRPGKFLTPDFAPYFLLQLNDHFLLEANVDITRAGIDVPTAQADWIVSDWLTVVAGRYLTPIGFFNERINHEWINKLPDVPLMFRQVSPLISTDGLQLRGAAYLGCSPVKIEYSLYGGNGLQLANAPTTLTQAADLGALVGAPDEVAAAAWGGRLGLWLPEWGITGGISGYFNDRWAPGATDHIRLWQLDAGYHQGNWDFRFEYADLYQQAASFIGNNIRRRGLYAQIAYRPYHASHELLQKTEIVFRYSMARFHGIDPTLLDLGAFGSPLDVPVDRNQYTIGLNYYFYPSMALRLAYEINRELGPVQLNDNAFLAQLVWAF